MQSHGNTLFVGIRINDRLQEQLDASPASMKPFFAANDPEYLQVMEIDAEKFIGKITASGTSLETLDNMLMNVKSMLRMICPKFTPAEGAIKIFALSPAKQPLASQSRS